MGAALQLRPFCKAVRETKILADIKQIKLASDKA
jgi:hypothetical protein